MNDDYLWVTTVFFVREFDTLKYMDWSWDQDLVSPRRKVSISKDMNFIFFYQHNGVFLKLVGGFKDSNGSQENAINNACHLNQSPL